MSIYRFADNSPIAEARFHTAPNRAPVALLAASEQADAEILTYLRGAMKQKGWQCVPVFAHGKAMLQLSGFKDAAEVTALLRTQKAVVGEPKIEMEESDLVTQSSKEWLNRSKLKLAGWLNAVGDVTLLAAGIKLKDRFMIAAGTLYTTGAVTLGLYGNVNTERQLQEASRDTANFIQQHTGPLPEDSGTAPAQVPKQPNLFHKAENYLYRHPADVMLGAYTAGAAAMVGSGITQKNNRRIGYGIWSLLVKTTSFLLPEKKQADGTPIKDTPPPGSIIGFFKWIIEKPLRLFGYGSIITELLLAGSAWKEFKSSDAKKKLGGFLGLTTAGMYVLSDMLMATASKDPTNADGKFSDDQTRKLAAMAAEAIAAQPEAARVKLATEVGGFLAKRPEMKASQAEITKAILEQAQHRAENRWVARTEVVDDAAMAQASR